MQNHFNKDFINGFQYVAKHMDNLDYKTYLNLYRYYRKSYLHMIHIKDIEMAFWYRGAISAIYGLLKNWVCLEQLELESIEII